MQMRKLPAWFTIHDVCLLVISKVVVNVQPMILEFSGPLALLINAMVPLSRWTCPGQDLGPGCRFLLKGRHWPGVYRSTWFSSFITITGFWDHSKLLEIAIELTLLHLDSVVVAV